MWPILGLLRDTAIQGKNMMDILKDFNLQQKKRNDDLIVTKMKTLCIRKRQKRNKCLIVSKSRIIIWKAQGVPQ